jgi:hypothetical protein
MTHTMALGLASGLLAFTAGLLLSPVIRKLIEAWF